MSRKLIIEFPLTGRLLIQILARLNIFSEEYLRTLQHLLVMVDCVQINIFIVTKESQKVKINNLKYISNPQKPKKFPKVLTKKSNKNDKFREF